MRTGIFSYYQKGERLRDFQKALKGILGKENVFLYDAFYPLKPPSSFELDPTSAEILYQVHSPDMAKSRPDLPKSSLLKTHKKLYIPSVNQLEGAVEKLVAQLVEKSPAAMRISKAYINRTAFIDADSRFELLIMSALVLGASEDAQEGMRAFAEKRKPAYEGR